MRDTLSLDYFTEKGDMCINALNIKRQREYTLGYISRTV